MLSSPPLACRQWGNSSDRCCIIGAQTLIASVLKCLYFHASTRLRYYCMFVYTCMYMHECTETHTPYLHLQRQHQHSDAYAPHGNGLTGLSLGDVQCLGKLGKTETVATTISADDSNWREMQTGVVRANPTTYLTRSSTLSSQVCAPSDDHGDAIEER